MVTPTRSYSRSSLRSLEDLRLANSLLGTLNPDARINAGRRPSGTGRTRLFSSALWAVNSLTLLSSTRLTRLTSNGIQPASCTFSWPWMPSSSLIRIMLAMAGLFTSTSVARARTWPPLDRQQLLVDHGLQGPGVLGADTFARPSGIASRMRVGACCGFGVQRGEDQVAGGRGADGGMVSGSRISSTRITSGLHAWRPRYRSRSCPHRLPLHAGRSVTCPRCA